MVGPDGFEPPTAGFEDQDSSTELRTENRSTLDTSLNICMKQILSQRCITVTYDPEQDQSQQHGWLKFCDEHQPTESEQDRWGRIMIAITLIMSLIALISLS